MLVDEQQIIDALCQTFQMVGLSFFFLLFSGSAWNFTSGDPKRTFIGNTFLFLMF